MYACVNQDLMLSLRISYDDMIQLPVIFGCSDGIDLHLGIICLKNI